MSPTETTNEETFSATPEAVAAEAQHDHDHDHAMVTSTITIEPAPTLNPELTRSIEVEAPAADVDKAFRQVTRRYAKMARIPGLPRRQGAGVADQVPLRQRGAAGGSGVAGVGQVPPRARGSST